jgi:hypothetical protein
MGGLKLKNMNVAGLGAAVAGIRKAVERRPLATAADGGAITYPGIPPDLIHHLSQVCPE